MRGPRSRPSFAALGILRFTALPLVVAGCHWSDSWKRVQLEPQALGNDVAVIWSHGTCKEWKSVVITPDSVMGLPVDGCGLWGTGSRRSVALADVDSIQLSHRGNPTGEYAFVIVTLSVMVYLLAQPDHPKCFYQHTC